MFQLFQIKPATTFYNFLVLFFQMLFEYFKRVWHWKAFSIWEIWTHSNVYIDYSFVIEKETNEKSFDCSHW